MKKIFLSLFAVLAVACGTPKDRFVIEGRVPSLPDSTMLLLDRFEGNLLQTVDTAYVIDGRFSFQYPLEEKELIVILGRSDDLPSMFLKIWAEPGKKATIRGENNLLYTWSVQSPVTEQRESEYFKQANKEEWDEYQRIGLQVDPLFDARAAASGEERNRIAEQITSLRSQQDSIMQRIYDIKLTLLAQREFSSIFFEELNGISMMIFHYPDRYGFLKERAIEQYERLPDELKNSPEGNDIRIHLFPPVKVDTGDRMADATLPDLDGKMHSISDYLGKYILLDFWSAGCGPCIMAMPELGEVAEALKEKLTIIGLSSDPNSAWKESSEKYNVTWVNLNTSTDPELNARYGVSAIPHQVIISPEGIVLGSWTGYGKGHIREQLKNYISGLE